MGVVIAEVGDQRDPAELLQIIEPAAHLGKERLLLPETSLGQQVARDEHEAGPLGFHGGDQVIPLCNPLVQVASDDEFHWMRIVAGLGAVCTTKGMSGDNGMPVW